MGNDTKKARRVKPEKPCPEFPLFVHATKRWAKKIKGDLHYFGAWEDWQAALNRYLEERDDLEAGRKPRKAINGQITTRDVINFFLTSKEAAKNNGDLTERSYRDYDGTCQRVLKCFGKKRAAENLGPADFRDYAQTMAGWAAVTRSNEIQRVRSIFKYAYESELISKPLNFGPDFKKPGAKIIRAAKANKPRRLSSREDIRSLLDACEVSYNPDDMQGTGKERKIQKAKLWRAQASGIQMKAMILLGINCALRNTDVSDLNFEHLDLDAGILDYTRGKTSIERRAAMWPETVEALRKAIAYGREVLTVNENKGQPRYHPTDPDDANAVFITSQQRRFVRQDSKTNRDSVAMAFGKLLRTKGIKKKGVNFYSLRHTFETVAGGAGDQPAVDRVMGHIDDHVRANYTHWLKDEAENKRLRGVADHVHKWLFGN
jgi:integrase